MCIHVGQVLKLLKECWKVYYCYLRSEFDVRYVMRSCEIIDLSWVNLRYWILMM